MLKARAVKHTVLKGVGRKISKGGGGGAKKKKTKK